jgi:hypothetical protein
VEDGGNEMTLNGFSSKTVGAGQMEIKKVNLNAAQKTFCKRLICSVNVVMGYCDDVDKAMENCKASVLTSDMHSKVGPEELSREWNIGLEMAKATLDVMMQHGVQTAVHSMSRQLRVDHIHLHRPRLKGT